jgi:hypothetical protein
MLSRFIIALTVLIAAVPAQADRVDITVWNAQVIPYGSGYYFGTYDCFWPDPPYVTILANFQTVPLPGQSPGMAVPHDQINLELFSGSTTLYTMSGVNRTHWNGTWWAPGSTTAGLPQFMVWWPHGQVGQWFRQPNTEWVLGPSRLHSGHRYPFSGVLTLDDGTTFDCARLNSGRNPGVLLSVHGWRPDRPPDRIDFTVTLTDNIAAPWPVRHPADLNRDGSVTVADLTHFLMCFFCSDPSADFDRSGAVTTQDIFDFLSAYLTP